MWKRRSFVVEEKAVRSDQSRFLQKNIEILTQENVQEIKTELGSSFIEWCHAQLKVKSFGSSFGSLTFEVTCIYRIIWASSIKELIMKETWNFLYRRQVQKTLDCWFWRACYRRWNAAVGKHHFCRAAMAKGWLDPKKCEWSCCPYLCLDPTREICILSTTCALAAGAVHVGVWLDCYWRLCSADLDIVMIPCRLPQITRPERVGWPIAWWLTIN